MHDCDEMLLRKLTESAEYLGECHDLDRERAEWLALLHLVVALIGLDVALPSSVSAAIAAALGDDEILEAATGPTGLLGIVADDESVDRFHRLLDATVSELTLAPPGAHVALARSHEFRGDLPGMERELRMALRGDPQHRAANTDLGELAALRGDARSARRHLDRARRPPLGWAAIAESLGHGPVSAGRNEPCPCGSGERFKRCCDATDGWSLALRAMLLRARVGDWIDRLVWRRRRLGLACATVGVDAIEDDVEGVVGAVVNEILADVHLFEGGGLETLAFEVGPILRPDERAVLDSWRGHHHGVFEVLGRGRARGSWALRAPSGGVTREVVGLDSEALECGAGWLVAVLVPAWQPQPDLLFACTEPVALTEADASEIAGLLEQGPDAVTLARTLVAPRLGLDRVGQELRSDSEWSTRLRWLFGDHVDVDAVRHLGDLDDLVTTIFMRGGGFSTAADFIRLAGRQLVAGEPPEVWEAAQRLDSCGYDREWILTELACAWAVATATSCDLDEIHRAHVAHLDSLPTTHRRRGG